MFTAKMVQNAVKNSEQVEGLDEWIERDLVELFNETKLKTCIISSNIIKGKGWDMVSFINEMLRRGFSVTYDQSVDWESGPHYSISIPPQGE